ncbi:hypothetical protein QL285_012867 [Trifolium repens]|nr:hypothetical protein QL285_012867 [Trifolium repens]
MIIQTSYLIPIDISVCSTIPQWPHPLDNPITGSRLVMNSPEGHPILSSKDHPNLVLTCNPLSVDVHSSIISTSK